MSVIKADIGSIGGQIQPSKGVLDAVALPISELEYTCIADTLKSLDRRFRVRGGAAPRVATG